MPAPFPRGFRFHIGRAEVEVKGRTRWDVCAIFGLILIPTRDGVSRPGLLLHEDDLFVGDLVLQLEARPVLEAVHLVAELAGVVEEHPNPLVVVAKQEKGIEAKNIRLCIRLELNQIVVIYDHY